MTASMDYMHTFIHPQIIIIDDASREDAFFVSAIRSKAMDIGRGVIELPPNAMETMMWLTRLDSGSLAGISCKSCLRILADVFSVDCHLCRHIDSSPSRVVGLSCATPEIH